VQLPQDAVGSCAILRRVVLAHVHAVSLAPCATIAAMRRTMSVLLVAAVIFLVTFLVADANHVPAWEQDVTEWCSDAPDWFVAVLWPVMQLGSFWVGVVGIGLVAAVVFGPRRGTAVFASGLLAWFLAQVVKNTVERGRPADFIPDIHVRDGRTSGFGYVSGHAAVAFAVATALMPVLPRWARVVAYVLATTVGIARLVYGVHFPLDVIGGACLGIMCACTVELAFALAGRRRVLRARVSSVD
jgi:undecaprenyl-diphosphatase